LPSVATAASRVRGVPREVSGTIEKSRFIETHVMRVGPTALVGHVLSLSVLAEIGRVEDTIDLVLSPATIARAISAGAMSDEIRDRIEAICPLPEGLSQLLVQASAVIGKASLVACSAFLWVDDPEVREMLRTRRTTQDLFVEPSPPGGLLAVPGVDFERLVRRCRGLGVEIELSGEGMLRVATPARGVMAMREGRSVTPYPGVAVEAPRPSSDGRGSGTRAVPGKVTPEPRPAPSRSRTPLPRTR
jgi:hypothetical protein